MGVYVLNLCRSQQWHPIERHTPTHTSRMKIFRPFLWLPLGTYTGRVTTNPRPPMWDGPRTVFPTQDITSPSSVGPGGRVDVNLCDSHVSDVEVTHDAHSGTWSYYTDGERPVATLRFTQSLRWKMADHVRKRHHDKLIHYGTVFRKQDRSRRREGRREGWVGTVLGRHLV